MSLLHVVGERRNAPPGLHRGRAGRMPAPHAGHAPKPPNLTLSILSGLLAGHRGLRGNMARSVLTSTRTECASNYTTCLRRGRGLGLQLPAPSCPNATALRPTSRVVSIAGSPPTPTTPSSPRSGCSAYPCLNEQDPPRRADWTLTSTNGPGFDQDSGLHPIRSTQRLPVV
ncbi:hypothetical protein GY45DRAFT_710761 [Cubamyces sp. BRFM 1775]|nr:hypothetical protein GY45DRAFT_710761 [Cubamyces sp. BRFM 1775]